MKEQIPQSIFLRIEVINGIAKNESTDIFCSMFIAGSICRVGPTSVVNYGFGGSVVVAVNGSFTILTNGIRVGGLVSLFSSFG